ISIGLMKLVNNKDFFSPVPLFTLTMYIVQIATITIIYFLIAPNILKKINWKRILTAVVLSYATFIAIRYFIEQFLTSLLFNSVNYFKETPLSFYIYDNLHFGSFIVFSTLLIWNILYLIKTLQQNNIKEQQKKNAEIKFLKAQINPHFLFNTLNNIYSLVSINSDKSLTAIENLSAIMRFTTYETNKEKIEISKEIDYINQYLALEQIRFSEKFYVEKKIHLENNSTEIQPYIISPLIENAIKHGIVKDINYPIKINISSTTESVEISIQNKINKNQKDEFSGIGLTNLKRRLTHYFGNNYTLEIKNDDEIFSVYLKIQLDA
ncbi:MAG: histidine kinase, partial [Flavobacteriaceae bacterium]|nr:histidine kinase [Candidatus Onthonaster equi]